MPFSALFNPSPCSINTTSNSGSPSHSVEGNISMENILAFIEVAQNQLK
jgi:hypothetical protein